MSSSSGTSGQCWWRMSRQNGFISHWKRTLKPARS